MKYRIFLITKIGAGSANCTILLLKLNTKYRDATSHLPGVTLGDRFSNVLNMRSLCPTDENGSDTNKYRQFFLSDQIFGLNSDTNTVQIIRNIKCLVRI
jgi:hypothetical protein